MIMEDAQKKLEEEKQALEEERLRVYDSGISSRAENGYDLEPESPKPRRRRRRKNQETEENSRPNRRDRPEVGKAPPPDFEKIKSKVGSRENRHYKPHTAR